MEMLRRSLARREQSSESVKQFTQPLNAVKSIFPAQIGWGKSFFDIVVETVKFVHRPTAGPALHELRIGSIPCATRDPAPRCCAFSL
jgi:hypothetical protein